MEERMEFAEFNTHSVSDRTETTMQRLWGYGKQALKASGYLLGAVSTYYLFKGISKFWTNKTVSVKKLQGKQAITIGKSSVKGLASSQEGIQKPLKDVASKVTLQLNSHPVTKRTVAEGIQEFQVNTFTIGDQATPSIAVLNNGNFVVSWESFQQNAQSSNFDIFGQVINIQGKHVSSEFPVNSFTNNAQRNSDIVGLSNGNFVVVWESDFQPPGDSLDIYGQLFDNTGVTIGSEFLVNSGVITSSQYGPSVSSLNSGFVVLWTSADGDSSGIFGKIYNNAGTAISSRFQVNDYTTNKQEHPRVSSSSNNNFLVAWDSFGQDGSKNGVYAHMFNGAGSKVLGSEIQVNTQTNEDQYDVAVEALGNGNFVLAWSSNNQDGDGSGIYAQLIDANGIKQGGGVSSKHSGDC